MELIAGDIGGTKSWLAWVTGEAGGVQQLRFEQVYPSAAFATADDLIRQFIADAGQAALPDGVVLALPGPVHAQHTTLTNLDWTLEAADMAASLGIARVRFINDFQAAAAGVATLTAADVVAINPQPAEPGGVRAITGAGTGLGLAFMLAGESGRYREFPSEGGHIDFAQPMRCRRACLSGCAPPIATCQWERGGVRPGDERAVPLLLRRAKTRRCRTRRSMVPRWSHGLTRAIRQPARRSICSSICMGRGSAMWRCCCSRVAGCISQAAIATHLQARIQSARFMAAATDKGRMRGRGRAHPDLSGHQRPAGRAGRDCDRIFPEMIHNLETHIKTTSIWSGT